MIDSLVAVRSILRADATVNSIVSDRIWINEAVQNAETTSIVIRLISGSSEYTHQGNEDYPRDIARVFCRSKDLETLNDLSHATKSALDGYAGTVDGVVVDRIFQRNRNGDYDDRTEIKRVIQDFEVRWRDS
ncbi:MAG: hypothetical protein AAF468_20180 [Pseudomonadota bacterium]